MYLRPVPGGFIGHDPVSDRRSRPDAAGLSADHHSRAGSVGTGRSEVESMRWGRLRLVFAVMVAVPVASLGGAAAQEVYLGADGVWRYTAPPTVAGPSRPLIRGAPVDDALRALVPSYDDPGWSGPDAAPYDEPYGEAPPTDGAAGVEPTPGDLPYESRVDEGGYVLRTVPAERFFDPGSSATLNDPYALPRIEDGPAGGYYGDPQQGEIPLPDVGAVPGADQMIDAFARYAAAKRGALAETDPGARLAAIRRANAYLLTLSRGDLSTGSIRAVDLALGITPVSNDTVQLPGAGTEVMRPDRKPAKADRDAARRLVEYGLLRNRGEAADVAVGRVMGDETGLGAQETAGLDRFLGLDSGFFVSTY
jgi:hypothetical protein